MGHIVLPVAGDGGDVEALHVVESRLSVAIHYIVNGALVVLLEHIHVQHVLAHEELVRHTDHLVTAVLVEEDDIVDVRAVGHKLVLLERGSDEAVFSVDIKFLVGFHHLSSFDGVEVAELGAARIVLAVLVLQHLEPVDGIVHDVCQLEVDFFDFLLDAGDVLVGLVLVELQDALHLDFQQTEDVLLGHFAHKLRIVWSEAVVDVCAGSIHVVRLFELLVLIDAFFDEDFFQ